MRHARVHLQIRKRSESDTKMVIWRIIGTSTRFEFSRRMQLNGSDILLISRRRKKETNISQDLVVDELSLHNSMTWSWESCQNPLFGLDGSIILTFNSLYIRLNIFPNKRIIKLCTVVAASRPPSIIESSAEPHFWHLQHPTFNHTFMASLEGVYSSTGTCRDWQKHLTV